MIRRLIRRERRRMLELLDDFPGTVLAVRASGHITKEDYDEVLVPAVEAAFARHPKLRVYYETAPDFSGYELGAMWEDFTLGIGHWTGWERVAIVTGKDWLKHAADAFRFFIPCPIKIFAPSEAAAARAWIAGDA